MLLKIQINFLKIHCVLRLTILSLMKKLFQFLFMTCTTQIAVF